MLTQKAKYAIKALLYLAQQKSLVRTQEIANKALIPKKFLEGILLELKSHKLVASVQGASGGYTLIKDPATISLADIYRIFEGPIALVPCASVNFYARCADCEDERTCVIRKAMVEVRKSTLEALEGQTIETMLMKRRRSR
jgi:Rrf2 family protein